jgi:Ca2+-binding EF-hand superfamily protein
MRRLVWTLGVCLITAMPAVAQDAGDDDGGRRPGRRRDFGDTGDDAQADDQGGGRRPGRGRDFGDDAGQGDDQGDQGGFGGGRGGRGGRGGFGGGFGGRGGNLLFSTLDADSDGTISQTELRRAVASLTKLDQDGDKSISAEEAGVRGGGPFGDPARMVERWLENDADGDGQLSEDELPGFMAQMMGQADTNGDGALDRAELTAAAEQFGRRFGGGGFGGPGGGFGGPGADPRAMVQQFDRNGDGMLQPQEIPPQMMRMFQGADGNGDGAIDQQELAEISRRMQERFGGGGRGGRAGRGGDDGGFGGPGGEGGDDDAGDDGGRRGRRRPPAEDEE